MTRRSSSTSKKTTKRSPPPSKKAKKQVIPRKVFTPKQIEAVINARGNLKEVAKKVGMSYRSAKRYRQMDRNGVLNPSDERRLKHECMELTLRQLRESVRPPTSRTKRITYAKVVTHYNSLVENDSRFKLLQQISTPCLNIFLSKMRADKNENGKLRHFKVIHPNTELSEQAQYFLEKQRPGW